MKHILQRLRQIRLLPFTCFLLLLTSNVVTGYLVFAGDHQIGRIGQASQAPTKATDYMAVERRLERIEHRLDDRSPQNTDDHWAAQLVTYVEVALVMVGTVALWLWVGRPVLAHSRGARQAQHFDVA